MKNMAERDDAAALRALQDRLCVYKEKHFIRAVRVTQITTNDWGVEFMFQTVPAPGFDQDDRVSFSASVSWEVIDVSERSVSATWMSWVLVVRPDLVEQITSAAAQGEKDVELMEYVNKLAFDVQAD